MFQEVRDYLDTDALNFPDEILLPLLRRIWFQALAMEKEWAFLHQEGVLVVTASERDVLAAPVVNAVATPAMRFFNIRDEYGYPLPWMEEGLAQRQWGDQVGDPRVWTDHVEGGVRYVRLYPVPVMDRTLTAGFYAEAVFPTYPTGTFADLPREFDETLKEGLIAEMYMREEDPDLYQAHRSIFLEQMGSIRAHWRGSVSTPVVMNLRALSNRSDRAKYRMADVGWPSTPDTSW
jgi:hypothetical protein